MHRSIILVFITHTRLYWVAREIRLSKIYFFLDTFISFFHYEILLKYSTIQGACKCNTFLFYCETLICYLCTQSVMHSQFKIFITARKILKHYKISIRYKCIKFLSNIVDNALRSMQKSCTARKTQSLTSSCAFTSQTLSLVSMGITQHSCFM